MIPPDTVPDLKEKTFRPCDGQQLPVLDPLTRLLLRLYTFVPCSALKAPILSRLGFPKGQVDFLPGFRCISGNIRVSGKAFLGETHFVDYAPVYLGNNVGFSYRNIVVTSSHQVGDFSTVVTKPIIIEDNVWITTNVTILGGVTIGKNSIIGAGSVVTKDIPPNCFAAGNPCQKIRDL